MPKKITLEDVARAAKVSPATVSRVVAGAPTVDPDLRMKVRKTAEKLGIDLEQRRKTKSKVVTFLLGNRDFLHPFQARLLMGAEACCTENNWEVLFLCFRYTPEIPAHALHLPQLLSDQSNACGVILAGSHYPNMLTALYDRGIPFATVGSSVIGDWKPEMCDVVYPDDISGAKEATEYLISKGHRSIAFVGNLQLPWFVRCSTGYARAMQEAGLAPRILEFRSNETQGGYLTTKTHFARSDRPTAILAGNDQIATGVYEALRELKLGVPDDVSVAGINDTQASLLSPRLTSVREFPEEMGRTLAEFVLNRLRKPTLPPQHLVIPTQLVTRDSVAKPAVSAQLPDAAA
jgi:DNA-binding LacI/PurR family transcriptional regulator